MPQFPQEIIAGLIKAIWKDHGGYSNSPLMIKQNITNIKYQEHQK